MRNETLLQQFSKVASRPRRRTPRLLAVVQTVVEALERRTMLSASIQVEDIDSQADSHTVIVTYTDPQGIDTTTIDPTDLTVSGPGLVEVSLVGSTGSGETVTATYSLATPDGEWDAADNGEYNLSIDADDVKDSAGNNLDAPAAESFTVGILPPADTVAPSAVIEVADVTAAGGATHTIRVTYSDDSGIDAASITPDDIILSRSGGGSLNVTGVTVSGSGASPTATYTFDAPGGSWDAGDNGAYTATLSANAVQDASTNANGNAAASATFNVNIAAPVDTTGPSAVIQVGDVTAAGSTHTVVITYSDDSGINASTIAVEDISVSRNGGTPLTVSAVNITGTGNSRTAAYTLAAPGGSWDAADNGIYMVSLPANAVRDASPNANGNASATGGFSVNVAPATSDTTPPAASIAVSNITTPGGASHTVVVTYTDETAIDATTVGIADIQVTQEIGGAGVEVTGVTSQVSQDGKTATATYTIAAPGGAFDAADNGAYTVLLRAAEVKDLAGNSVASASSAAFSVNIDPAPGSPGDETAPQAVISAENITAPGAASQTVTVVYTDKGSILAGTIGADDISVSSGGAALQVSGVTTTRENAGAKITAVYTIAAPGGAWDAADNGVYTVTVAAGAITDTQGNANPAATGTFTVNATVIDEAIPTVTSITAPSITSEGVRRQRVTVTYADDIAIDLATIGTDDITITGPGGAVTVDVAEVNAGTNGAATVTYAFAPPGGGRFTTAHNGAYAVTVNADAVRDTAAKGIAPAAGAFEISVPAPPPIDPGFGNGDPVIVTFAAEAAVSGRDGKIILAGRSGDNAVLERRNADGSIDTSFNRTGQFVSTTDDAYYAAVAQGDKVIVGGTAGGDFVLARYSANGKLDTSFGAGGRTVVDFGQQNDVAYGLALDAAGNVIAVGQSDGDFAIARFNGDGGLEAAFGDGGKRTLDLGGNDLASSVAVELGGNIVLSGASDTNVAVVRLGGDGLTDGAFAVDGILIIPGLVARNETTTADRAIALALQPDGKILVANHTPGDDFGAARIDAAGHIDATFGAGGVATADFGGLDDADAIIVQPSGEIIVLGTSLIGQTASTTLAAFDASGQLIDAFATGGKLTLDAALASAPAERELRIADIVLRAFGTRQPDGRIVLGASTTTSTVQTTQTALRRVNAPGAQVGAAGIPIGTFGTIEGRVQKLVYTDGDGTQMTMKVRGGSGAAFLGADNRINLEITDSGAGATVRIKGKGGDGRMALGDVTVNGALRKMAVKNGDLTGTFCSTGPIGKLTLGNVSDALICSAGDILKITADNLTRTRVFAGADLGDEGELGGSGGNADAYNAASIGKLRVRGEIAESTVGAGLDPVDSTFLNGNDQIAGGQASVIRSIVAGGADEKARFLAGSFGKAKLGGKVSPAEDSRFRTPV